MSGAIYKIARVREWKEAVNGGVFTGSVDDKRDGFIHFSTAAQVRATCDKHFAAEERLYLVAVDPDRLGSALKWEPSRGGQNFPHLYGTLPLALVHSVTEIQRGFDGKPIFPPEIA
jgi:uncharacterized protein (DUF952 family)